MRYSELIELYKAEKLDKEQMDMVKNDIERHEAISNYLFDENIPDFEEIEIASKDTAQKDDSDEQTKFLKMIKSSIRKAFIKTGFIVGIVVLAICMFVIFAMPKLVDSFYYNPCEITGTKDGLETNRISVDMMVYTELFIPGYFRCDVDADSNGYGEYDINIRQFSSYNGLFTDVAGTIKKGELSLYDNNILKRPIGSAFVPAEDVVNDWNGLSRDENLEYALKELEKLDDNDYYIAYVTLDKVMNYEEFVEWTSKNNLNPIWCAICQKDEKAYPETDGYFTDDTIGFIYASSAMEMYYDKEKYPYLSYFDATVEADKGEDWIIPKDVMTTHVISMLRYMEDQKEFRKMMESYDDGYLKAIADNIEENGLNIYGYAVIAKQETLLELKDVEGLQYIFTRPIR